MRFGAVSFGRSYCRRSLITDASEAGPSRVKLVGSGTDAAAESQCVEIAGDERMGKPGTLLDSCDFLGHHDGLVHVKIETERLQLRPLALHDAPTLARLAGRREIADTTISIPHPYSEQHAREWIEKHTGQENPPKQIAFAITLKTHGQLMGTVGLREIDHQHCQAEMGFWIDVDSWGNGYATEAARAVLRYGFGELKLNRIHAHYMVRNPASGRVLEKIGMKREGLLRQRVRKWSVFEDVVLMAILKHDCLLDVPADPGGFRRAF